MLQTALVQGVEDIPLVNALLAKEQKINNKERDKNNF